MLEELLRRLDVFHHARLVEIGMHHVVHRRVDAGKRNQQQVDRAVQVTDAFGIELVAVAHHVEADRVAAHVVHEFEKFGMRGGLAVACDDGAEHILRRQALQRLPPGWFGHELGVLDQTPRAHRAKRIAFAGPLDVDGDMVGTHSVVPGSGSAGTRRGI
jgi:hypothetical protein